MGVVQSMQSFGRSVGPLFAGSLFAYWEGLPYLAGVILMAIALVWMIMLTRSVMIDDASVRGNSSEKTSEKVREKTLKNVKEDVK